MVGDLKQKRCGASTGEHTRFWFGYESVERNYGPFYGFRLYGFRRREPTVVFVRALFMYV